MKILTEENYKFIESEVELFNKRTKDYHDVDPLDVIHSFFNPGEVLNDWDEGPNADPYWDVEHSVIKFINDTVNIINRDKKINEILK